MGMEGVVIDPQNYIIAALARTLWDAAPITTEIERARVELPNDICWGTKSLVFFVDKMEQQAVALDSSAIASPRADSV